MAAVITTLAPHSFIYENAIILHHQMSSGSRGNMTQMKEALEAARELDRRMNTPVAKKMGISLEAFRKKMYEHNSDGDWEEYGDKAVKLHWVDKVVKRVEETGVVKKPEKNSSSNLIISLLGMKEEQTDANGVKYVPLPRLEPFDFYYIYNRDNYFR
jgi:ATP-dependent Clp protease protease subunit